MKMIMILLLLQLAVLSGLVYKSIQVDKQLVGISSHLEKQPAVLTVEPAVEIAKSDTGLDEQNLRRIIRAEFRTLSNALAEALPESPEPPTEIDPVENAVQLDVVNQELAYYIRAGEISDLEMQNLQSEMARLDKESQKKMLGQLVRALNTGELKGQL